MLPIIRPNTIPGVCSMPFDVSLPYYWQIICCLCVTSSIVSCLQALHNCTKSMKVTFTVYFQFSIRCILIFMFAACSPYPVTLGQRWHPSDYLDILLCTLMRFV